MKINKKKVKFTVDDPIFKTETLFLLGYDNTAMAKEMIKRGAYDFNAEELQNSTGAQLVVREYTDDKKRFYKSVRVVWVESWGKTPECIGVIAHEIFHLVITICSFKEVHVNEEDNETGAYLMDFYMRQAMGHLLNKKPDW